MADLIFHNLEEKKEMKSVIKQKTVAVAVGSLLIGSIGGISTASADNPFAINSLESGYMVVAEKTGEGKCGTAKCGGEKKEEMKEKMHEGKCGGEKAEKAEGKCGEGKKMEGKCGEGKAEKAEGKCGEGKKMEGKCGDSK
jgi:uncharacterized low-complexity protein